VTLYLLSGWATTNAIWEPIAPMLNDGLKIECIDWKAAIEGELGRRLKGNPERCIVAGWSMGGQIALSQAANHHDVLAGLFLISSMTCLVGSGCRPGVSEEIPIQIGELIQRNRRLYLRAFFTQCLGPARNTRILHGLMEQSDSFPEELLLSGLEFMSEKKAVSTGDIPVMVVHGREDRVIPWKCSEYIARRVKGSVRAEYLDDAGHLLPVLEPAKIADLLNEFCDSCAC